MSAEASKHARQLLLKEYRGVLATHSQAMPGFPFGSVVPYCLDANGWPLILISRIAQHTRNLKADGRCSLLVGERAAEDVQAAGRLTLLAEARQLAEPAAIESAAQRYYRYFPESRDYHRVHDFDFWVLEPVRWRYIGGFGAIHWLDRVALANPFAVESGEVEQGMVEHMNDDHSSALAGYWARFGDGEADGEITMCGIDAEGCDLLCNGRRLRVPFDRSIGTTKEAREILIELARG